MTAPSIFERLLGLDPGTRKALFADLPHDAVAALTVDWEVLARPAQLPPDGDWRTWLILAGRGFGKTRAGAGWVHGLAREHPGARIALIGATLHDARTVMVEGESGLLAQAPAGFRPVFHPSLRTLTWPEGATGLLFSAAEPESLRGPQFDFAWGDEVARWSAAEAALANLRLGLRIGERPRLLLTTTPRPKRWLKALAAAEGTVVTRGASRDNAANLARGFIADVEAEFGDTRFGRQELGGEIIDDIDGALWNRAMLEACRVREHPPLARVVIGVDPPAGEGATSDACGIIVAGLGEDGLGYVLADASVQGLAPDGWARAVCAAAALFAADRVVAEVNQGGAMVSAMLRSVESSLPVKSVRATHGKVARAEPVAALYGSLRIRHVGGLPRLEDELCGLITGGRYEGPGRSPDRADALVWALSELMLGKRREPGVRAL